MSALNIADGEASAILPSCIPEAETFDELIAGIESLQKCFNVLSPACYTAQQRWLVPALRNKIASELDVAVRELSGELPQELKQKLSLLHKGLRKRLEKLTPSNQIPVDSFAIREVIGLAHKLCLATGSDTKKTIDELFHRLEEYGALAGPAYDLTLEYLSDYIFAAVYFEIEELGFSLPNATYAKIMLYYSMRFAASSGDLEFWDTPIYKELVLKAGA